MWCLAPRAADGVPRPWGCDKCPVFKSDGGFGVMVNEFAAGSGTPHTNINLASMRTLADFLRDEFGVLVDTSDYAVLENYVKEWPLNKPRGSVTWGQYNGLIRRLKATCPWLQYRIQDTFYDDYPGSQAPGQQRF
jgi:hypothetical protein